jgi:hypothetical protein
MMTKPKPPLHVNGLADRQQLRFPFLPLPCEHSGSALRWHRWARDGGIHLGALCVGCGSWKRWVPQIPENLVRAPAKPR